MSVIRPSSVITNRKDNIENHAKKLLHLAFGPLIPWKGKQLQKTESRLFKMKRIPIHCVYSQNEFDHPSIQRGTPDTMQYMQNTCENLLWVDAEQVPTHGQTMLSCLAPCTSFHIIEMIALELTTRVEGPVLSTSWIVITWNVDWWVTLLMWTNQGKT